MSLASRLTGNNSGTNHGVPTTSSKVANAAPAAFPTTTQAPVGGCTMNNPSISTRSSGALMNLLNSGLSVPRQVMVQARGAQDNQHVPIHLNFIGTIGQGTFGQIERATLTVVSNPGSSEKVDLKSNNDTNVSTFHVAVKRVLQDPRYKNRELSIMQKLNMHPNIVKFYYYYYSTASSSSRSHRGGAGRSGSGSSNVDVFLHLVLECFPGSLCELIYRYSQRNLKIPVYLVKVFTYQMLKALSYLHSHQICHRDIKSSNLLVNESTAILKVCDFGSAKEMVPGTANVSYISSRYYRAPELLFGAQLYTCAIDTWSGGCVLAEMLLQHCLFMGADSVDQLVRVIRVLGTPTPQDISSMNPMYGSYNFPDVQSCPVKLFFPQHTPADLLNLMSKMLVYNPSLRILPSQALLEPCFDELREIGPNGLLPNRVRMPPSIFDPDPEPNTPTMVQDTSNPNYWPNTDSHRHNSSCKKTPGVGDLSALDKKSGKKISGSRDVAGDWQRKGRTTSSVNSDKSISISSTGHIGELATTTTRTTTDNQIPQTTKALRSNNALKSGSIDGTEIGLTSGQLEGSDSENLGAATIANQHYQPYVTATSNRTNVNEVH